MLNLLTQNEFYTLSFKFWWYQGIKRTIGYVNVCSSAENQN